MLSAAVCATDGCHAQTGSLIIAVLMIAGSRQVCVCAFDALFFYAYFDLYLFHSH
jgi:NADH:ubiquinone oxidoreductase subunit 4 (subunit M)